MTGTKRAGVVFTAIAALVVVTGAAQAQLRSERVRITIDAPMMVPGTTLQPGTYMFELMDPGVSQQTVQIFKEDGTTPVATVHSIPTRRLEVTGDTVMKFNPASDGAPLAIKAWFYPGARFGHEFIYSDEEARQIAQRTKTVVLSGETGEDMNGSGTSYTYDANGTRATREADEATNREWKQWHDNRKNSADDCTNVRVEEPGTKDTRESTAPVMQQNANQDARMVEIDDLEDNPDKYVGQTVRVTGEVEDVFGPRLFTIDEPNWMDFDGETVVYVPADLAATVREDDQITVVGTVRQLENVELQPELEWFEGASDAEAEFKDRPAIVANDIVGGDSNRALWISVDPESADRMPKSEGHRNTDAALTDANEVTGGDDMLIGRSVTLTDVHVKRTGAHNGFWIESGGNHIYVMPSGRGDTQMTPASGDRVLLEGTVLALPRGMFKATGTEGRMHHDLDANNDIYIYATVVKK